jgi:hypothetical protein
MRNRLISLVFLVAFGFNLAAGHLPCRAEKAAWQTETESGMSCHGSGEPAGAATLRGGLPASGRECCSGEHGVCQHACHMVADVRGGASGFAVKESSQELPAAVDRTLPLFAHPIDHIPLA